MKTMNRGCSVPGSLSRQVQGHVRWHVQGPRPVLGLLSALVITSSGIAQSNEVDASGYRLGVPAVVGPAQAPTLPALPENGNRASRQASAERFREKYRSANRPSVILFWDQPLSGALTPQDYTPGNVGGVTGTDEERLFEGFTNALLSVGVRLVDRDLAVRKSTVSESSRKRFSNEATPNGQVVEALALELYADHVLEVLPVRAKGQGVAFRVRMLDTQTGQISINQVVKADTQTERSREELVITDSGYEYRTVQQSISPATKGENVAYKWFELY